MCRKYLLTSTHISCYTVSQRNTRLNFEVLTWIFTRLLKRQGNSEWVLHGCGKRYFGRKSDTWGLETAFLFHIRRLKKSEMMGLSNRRVIREGKRKEGCEMLSTKWPVLRRFWMKNFSADPCRQGDMLLEYLDERDRWDRSWDRRDYTAGFWEVPALCLSKAGAPGGPYYVFFGKTKPIKAFFGSPESLANQTKRDRKSNVGRLKREGILRVWREKQIWENRRHVATWQKWIFLKQLWITQEWDGLSFH